MHREGALVKTLVQLADSLLDEFDVVELLTVLTDQCVKIIAADAAGLMLRSPEGDLRVMASSSPSMRILELFELQAEEGPCLDCYRSGVGIVNQNLLKNQRRWPHFVPEALGAGFQTVHALPMRLRGSIVGALNLFSRDTELMPAADVEVAQAMTDIATIAILQQRAMVDAKVINDQLNWALNSRIVIEQAKGIVAERLSINVDDAFAILRSHARSHKVQLSSVATEVVEGTLTEIFHKQ